MIVREVSIRCMVATDFVASSGPVLIVDDDPHYADFVAGTFRREGYEVAVAWNGEEALGLLRRGFRPAVIFLDLIMPVMNGWRFRSAQLADATLKTIPVVVISKTAHDSPSIRAGLPGVAFLPRDAAPEAMVAAARQIEGSGKL
jgi:CheY-like chemotaxis protein